MSVLLSSLLFLLQSTQVDPAQAALETLEGAARLPKLVELAENLYISHPAKALAYAEEGMALIRQFPDPKKEFVFELTLAWSYTALGDAGRGMIHCDRAIPLAEPLGPRAMANALDTKSFIHLEKGENDEALALADQSLEEWRKLGDKVEIASAHNSIANILVSLGRTDKAHNHFMAALEGFTEMDKYEGMAAAYNGLGQIYRQQGFLDKALEFFVKARQLVDNHHISYWLSITSSNMGEVYLALENYEAAIDSFKLALENSIKQKEKRLISVHYNRIGVAHQKLGNYQHAMEYLNKGLEISESVGKQLQATRSLIHIAELLTETKRFPEAEEKLTRASKILLTANDPESLTETSLVFANLYLQWGRLDEAIAHADVAIGRAREHDLLEFLQRGYETLSGAHRQKGDYKAALDASLKVRGIKDRIYNEDASKKLALLQTQFEAESQEREIALLKKERDLKTVEAAYQKEEIESLRKNEQIQALQRNTWIGGSLLVVGLIAFLAYRRVKMIALTRQCEVNEELRALNRMKDAFLANTSHELRTPLNGIMGMTELLSQTKLNRTQREYNEIVHSSTETLLSIVNDVLDYSKSKAGKLVLENETFDLCDCVESIGDLLAQAAREKNLEFCILVDHRLPSKIDGDAGRLRQMLICLVNNAVKFTEKGHVVLRAKLLERNEDTIQVRFDIEDTGMGISESQISGLFKPFTQVDDSSTRRHGGTGLGLALARDIATLMDGEITVKSELGGGSHFTLTVRLKLAKESMQAEAPAQPERLPVLVLGESKLQSEALCEHLKALHCAPKLLTDFNALPQELADSQKDRHRLLLMPAALMEGADPDTRRILETWNSTDNHAIISIYDFIKQINPNTPDGSDYHWLAQPVKRGRLFRALLEIVKNKTGLSDEGQAISEASEQKITPANILLVEDNAVNRKVLVRLLEKRGYQCDAANNGQEALDACSRGKYDLILMDCQMPVMDGYEATKQIRIREADRIHVPIIAVTANATEEAKKKCLESGMDDFLSKPVRGQQLYNIIDAYLNRNLAGAASV